MHCGPNDVEHSIIGIHSSSNTLVVCMNWLWPTPNYSTIDAWSLGEGEGAGTIIVRQHISAAVHDLWGGVRMLPEQQDYDSRFTSSTWPD